MERGYAFVEFDGTKIPVRSVDDVGTGNTITAHLHDGRLCATVTETHKNPKSIAQPGVKP
jgi:exonuclease VII large subunit